MDDLATYLSGLITEQRSDSALFFQRDQTDRCLVSIGENDCISDIPYLWVVVLEELLQSRAREREMEGDVVGGHTVFQKEKGAGSTREPAPLR